MNNPEHEEHQQNQERNEQEEQQREQEEQQGGLQLNDEDEMWELTRKQLQKHANGLLAVIWIWIFSYSRPEDAEFTFTNKSFIERITKLVQFIYNGLRSQQEQILPLPETRSSIRFPSGNIRYVVGDVSQITHNTWEYLNV